jgi:hypothetical protein
MLGSAELSVTTRTRHIESTSDLATLIAETREMATAAGRSEPFDVLSSYDIPRDPTEDAPRHRNAIAELERIGVTWLVISGATRTPAETFEFLDAFGRTYLR